MLVNATSPRLFMTAVLLLFSVTVFSQTAVTGKVIGSDKQPVFGATIAVKGTTLGTQTTSQGTFSINVPDAKSVLVFSFVGHDPQEVVVGTQKDIVVNMVANTSTLNDVIVTGYSAQAKKDITGSVSVVNTKELVANPGSNVESLLQGRAAGVTVGTSGIPGAGSNVRIHGYSTFGNNEPLYVVDGTRVTSIADLNPGDIESMQVLKDASAASIYGSAAAGGVIIITTKKGRAGNPNLDKPEPNRTKTKS